MSAATQWTIRLFAGARDAAGGADCRVMLDAQATVGALKQAARRQFPRLQALPFRVAVNHEFADDGRALRPGDEIAFLPPVSGG